MITNTGKSIVSIKTNEGIVISIFNRTFHAWGSTINLNDMQNNKRYNIAIDQSYITNQYRCACFSMSYANNSLRTTPHLVVYAPDMSTKSNNGITAYPLFELISPSVNKTGDIYQLTWWSNVANYSQLTQINNIYQYDPSVIKKFSQSTISSEKSTNSSANLLCTAHIYFEKLKQSGSGTFDARPRITPVIHHVAIVDVITGQGYVTDFSSGGDDGGIGMHSHLDNNDGGYAAAVFMPSAIMKPFTWS